MPLLHDKCGKCHGCLGRTKTVGYASRWAKLCNKEERVVEEDLGASIKYKKQVKKTYRCKYCGRMESKDWATTITDDETRVEWKDDKCDE